MTDLSQLKKEIKFPVRYEPEEGLIKDSNEVYYVRIYWSAFKTNAEQHILGNYLADKINELEEKK